MVNSPNNITKALLLKGFPEIYGSISKAVRVQTADIFNYLEIVYGKIVRPIFEIEKDLGTRSCRAESEVREDRSQNLGRAGAATVTVTKYNPDQTRRARAYRRREELMGAVCSQSSHSL